VCRLSPHRPLALNCHPRKDFQQSRPASGGRGFIRRRGYKVPSGRFVSFVPAFHSFQRFIRSKGRRKPKTRQNQAAALSPSISHAQPRSTPVTCGRCTACEPSLARTTGRTNDDRFIKNRGRQPVGGGRFRVRPSAGAADRSAPLPGQPTQVPHPTPLDWSRLLVARSRPFFCFFGPYYGFSGVFCRSSGGSG